MVLINPNLPSFAIKKGPDSRRHSEADTSERPLGAGGLFGIDDGITRNQGEHDRDYREHDFGIGVGSHGKIHLSVIRIVT